MILERTNRLVIQTPEGIAFSLLLAGPISRFLAWVVDVGCVVAAGSLISVALAGLQWISVDLIRALSVLAYFGVSVGYAIALEWSWRGQTIGKRLLRLRVMDAEGLRLSFGQIVIRNLLRFVDMLPAFYFVGGLACLVSGKAQRLGDFAAGTVVVYTPRVFEPDLDQLLARKYNSFRNYPHLMARLRQRTSPVEASLALQALLRRDEFQPSSRVQLFSRIADHFRTLLEFPPEACEGIADEQYVRNVVDVLFRSEQHAKASLQPLSQPLGEALQRR
jgi:uncharacterized RDD family membrane protein YckC